MFGGIVCKFRCRETVKMKRKEKRKKTKKKMVERGVRGHVGVVIGVRALVFCVR